MIENKIFRQLDYTINHLPANEYEECTFNNCDFSNGTLSNITFIDCEFVDCNLSNVIISNTGFKTVVFDNCKILGTDFSSCIPFLLSMQFNSCQLNLSSFYQLNLKAKSFIDCNLHEVDFTETDLSSSLFKNCDLKGAIFDRTNLSKTNLVSSVNYSINPEDNNIKGATFSENGLAGLLEKYKIKVI